MRRYAKALATGLATAGVGALLAVTPAGGALEERLGLGWLFQLRGPIAPPSSVAVVALDRESADQLGLPRRIRDWPRTVHARIVDRLREAGASVIVFDLIFERARDADPAQDAALADAMARARRVILLEYLDRATRPLLERDDGTGIIVATEQVIQPIEPLAETAAGLAPFPLPKSSGRVTQFWTFRPPAGGRPTLPALALQQHVLTHAGGWSTLLGEAGVALPASASAAARTAAWSSLRRALQDDPALHARLAAALHAAAPDPEQRRLVAALLRTYTGPDSHYLNFYGPPGHLRTIPVRRLLAAPDADPDLQESLAGRAAFVGQSELADVQPDGFATVFSRSDGVDLSGVEIAATAFANLLDGRVLHPAPPTTGLLLVAGFGLAVGTAAGALPAAVAIAVALALGLAVLTGAHLAFARADLWLPLAVPLLVQLPLGLFAGLLVQHRDAQRARRNLSRGARYYLPEKVVAGLAEAPRDPAQATELVHAVCMVADAERFTSFAEHVPPRELNAFLNRYFELLFGAVERHGGLVTDVVGDGMTAVWSAAAPEACARLAACRAALEIDRAIARFNRERGAAGMQTRIGLHAGPVMLGNVGGGGRFAYSVIGDTVNTAARLESLNKQLGTRVLATTAAAGDLAGLALRPLGRFLLAGKEDVLALVEIVGLAGEVPAPEALARFAAALAAFEAERWDEAARRFETVLAAAPADGPAAFYLEQCRRYAHGAAPPSSPAVVRLERK